MYTITEIIILCGAKGEMKLYLTSSFAIEHILYFVETLLLPLQKSVERPAVAKEETTDRNFAK